ncbi:MAG: hypothetical protein K2J64_07585, partial [Desulfovibrio sp.]|nr:hypothetical protein [Desulfovibrio sp.]
QDVPTANKLAAEVLAPILVPASEFEKLTTMPILVVVGDNIIDTPSENFNQEAWRVIRERGRQFVDAINRHGGDATLVELPKIGIHGNTHAMMADRNNREVARHLKTWLRQKGLDGREIPHRGPAPLKISVPAAPQG